jgi:heterodisulfide reductase subunit B
VTAVAEKLAAARAKQAEREAREKEEAEAAELARFELIERLEKETNGREGRDFAIVDVSHLGEGFVAVRLGEAVHFKTFSNSKMTEADVDAFVVPCLLYPADKDEYRKLIMRRPAVAIQCAGALAALFGVKAQADRGK